MDNKTPDNIQDANAEQDGNATVKLDEKGQSRRSFAKSAVRAAPVIMTLSGVSLVSKPTAVAASSATSASS